MTLIVPDASVLLKWVLGDPREEDTAQAEALLATWKGGEVDLLVPSLWVYEVGNVLGIKRSREAPLLLQTLLDFELPACVLDEEILEETFHLMTQVKVTFYDACYHAIAICLEGTFLTADKRYYEKGQRKNHVALLAQFNKKMLMG